jgi:transketolase
MVSVVSFPCWELFEQQSKEYRMSVFPAGVPVVSVEASVTHGERLTFPSVARMSVYADL